MNRLVVPTIFALLLRVSAFVSIEVILILGYVYLFQLQLQLNLRICSRLILFAFRPLSGKQKHMDLSGLCVSAVNYSE